MVTRNVVRYKYHPTEEDENGRHRCCHTMITIDFKRRAQARKAREIVAALRYRSRMADDEIADFIMAEGTTLEMLDEIAGIAGVPASSAETWSIVLGLLP